MTENVYLTQTQLAERWQVAEGTLERWRSEGDPQGTLGALLAPTDT